MRIYYWFKLTVEARSIEFNKRTEKRTKHQTKRYTCIFDIFDIVQTVDTHLVAAYIKLKPP